MRISYKALFSVECLHGYFADRVCRTLTLRPTPAWERLRQRYQLLFRPSAGGGTVYYADAAEEQIRQIDREATPFAFILTSTDPLFDIYTESGTADAGSPADTIHYFSNRQVHAADVFGRPRSLLHPPGAPFADPPLPVRPSLFTHHFDRPVTDAVIQVADAAGRQPVWETRTPAQELRAWPVDLRGWAGGRYHLSVNGQQVLDFYLSDERAARQWGVVEIFATHLAVPPTYTIALSARETVWRYYIFDQPQAGSPYAGYEVVGVRKRSGGGEGAGSGDIRFTRRAETVTLNGRQAFVFESKQAMPLSEVPGEDDYLFTFKANGAGERGGRPIKLPFAQPATTKFDEASDGTRMCSEIFVYL